MANINGSIYIDRPPEVVFDFVADERNEPQYNPKMTTVSLLTDEPISAGSRFAATLVMRARPITMTVEFTEFVRPRRLASVTTTGPMDTVGALSFEPSGTGTLMSWSWHITLNGWAKIGSPVVSWMGRRQERAIWSTLKQLLERKDEDGT
jgi:carbon monoxide dehydrogenase subunit G